MRICAAERRVEVGQRLVEQEHLRVAHDGAADGDALALAAGELRRLAVEQLLELQHLAARAAAARSISAFSARAVFRPKVMLSATFMCG